MAFTFPYSTRDEPVLYNIEIVCLFSEVGKGCWEGILDLTTFFSNSRSVYDSMEEWDWDIAMTFFLGDGWMDGIPGDE